MEQEKNADIKQKKEYLKSYKKVVSQMERSDLRIREMRLNRMMPTIINDGMPHAHSNNDLSSYAALLDQEEKRYKKYRYQRVKKCKEIADRIEQLENEDEKDILMYRYIKLMKWEDICVRMDVSERQVHYLHSNALKHFKIFA